MAVPCFAGSLQLNSNVFDTSQFRVTEFATDLPLPLSMMQFSDGSLGVAAYYPGFIRFADTDFNGVADGPGSKVYGAAGAHTSVVKAGNYYVDGNFGDYLNGHFDQQVMTILKPGNSPDSQMSVVGQLKLGFPQDWEHSQTGMATRPTPGQPGHYDLVFNVGAEGDHEASAHKVELSGLISGTLDGDSLYAVTLDFTGAEPSAANLRKIASGIRNVIGMGFQPGTGDFYFVDNAIDGTGPDGDEPPQSDELNRIVAADFDNGVVPNFGFPNCYVGYRTGLTIDTGGTGCVQPFFAIQPIANGTVLGSESEGPSQMAFAPNDFPAAFRNGIFIGFSGKGGTGPANEENAVGFYDFNTNSYMHFVENSQEGVYQPIGIFTTSDSLFISDYAAGKVYQVTAAAPEPATLLMMLFGSFALAWWCKK
ncbi:MAG: glucose sorbosone dehydrogenase [Bryobacterales bacterium]|jgi:glucose/arabinose dehydrogenase|nr:glucose sorbosone dehydrogenase [Bryobacterales bacterium]